MSDNLQKLADEAARECANVRFDGITWTRDQRAAIILDAMQKAAMAEREQAAENNIRWAERIAELEDAGNLLALIHRDGGQHIGKVGWKQACKDAEAKVSTERAEVESEKNLRSQIANLHGAAQKLIPDTPMQSAIDRIVSVADRIAELERKTIEMRERIQNLRHKLAVVGICPDCGGEIKHALDEPIASCKCGSMEWTEPPPVLQMLRRELAEARKQYNDVILAVLNKYPNESRHETAKRLIRQAETGYAGSDAARAKESKDGS